MQLRYDEDFIEAAVFRCANGPRPPLQSFVAGATKDCRPPALQIARFHREREKCYGILDPDERSAAFFQVHLEWFREWGLEQPLAGLKQEFPLVCERLGAIAVRKASGRHDEGAELYINEYGERTGLLALRPERFADDAGRSAAFTPVQRENARSVPTIRESPASTTLKRAEARAPITLRDYLRHEFTHLHDMLDPAFGYAPVLDLPGLNAAQRRLARERYRLLWDITIDGRLAAAGHTPMATREQHAAAFERGYSFWPASRQVETLNSLWQCPAPRHADLLALIADPRGLRDASRPAPGGSCPLCEFPTFQWAVATALESAILQRIRAEFPAWQPEQGLCSRCLETYEAAASLELAYER